MRNKIRHRLRLIVRVLCTAFPVCGIETSAAKEFRVTPVKSFEKIFSRGSDPNIAKAFRGALVLRWNRKQFRGFSGLSIAAGDRLTAISDRGAWLELSLSFRNQFLVGARGPVLKRLRGPDGKKLKGKYRDAEALAPDGRGGFVIAFERQPRLLHYPPWRKPFFLKPTEITGPVEFAALQGNRGIEALTRLCDGRFLVIAQTSQPAGADAWLVGTGGWTGRRYARSDGFIPTGATTLPDCSVAVLERRETGRNGHGLRIQHLSAPVLGRTRTDAINPKRLFGPAFSPAFKFEGITAFGRTRSGVLIYLISDSDARTGTALASFAVRIPTE
jgi:hypothetical protein